MGPIKKASATVEISNEQGIHGRSASLFVRKASQFKCEIRVSKTPGVEINAKSVLGILKGGLNYGDTIHIEASGDDAKEAVDALVTLLNNKFGERS